MSNAKEEAVKFAKYRKDVIDLVAPTGELLAYGFIREFDASIPDEIRFVCARFLDLYLDESSSSTCFKESALQFMNSQQWNSMNAFERRLLRDKLVFDETNQVSLILCEPKTREFDIHWILPIIVNAHNLYFINLSNCYLNDNAVQLICDALRQNQQQHPKMATKRWLDLSDNDDLTDASMQHLLSVLPQLGGFNLNSTSITDKACVILSDYLNANKQIIQGEDGLSFVKLDGNSGITQSGQIALRPFISQDFQVLFD